MTSKKKKKACYQSHEHRTKAASYLVMMKSNIYVLHFFYFEIYSEN